MAETERIEEMVKALLESWRVTNPNAPMWQHPEEWYDTIEVMARAALSFLGFDPDNPPAEGAVAKARDALRAVDVWYALDGDGISEPTRSQVKTALAALAPCATCDGSGQITRVRMVPCIEYGPPQPGGRLMQTLGSAPQQELELCNACQGTGAALEGRNG